MQFFLGEIGDSSRTRRSGTAPEPDSHPQTRQNPPRRPLGEIGGNRGRAIGAIGVRARIQSAFRSLRVMGMGEIGKQEAVKKSTCRRIQCANKGLSSAKRGRKAINSHLPAPEPRSAAAGAAPGPPADLPKPAPAPIGVTTFLTIYLRHFQCCTHATPRQLPTPNVSYNCQTPARRPACNRRPLPPIGSNTEGAAIRPDHPRRKAHSHSCRQPRPRLALAVTNDKEIYHDK